MRRLRAACGCGCVSNSAFVSTLFFEWTTDGGGDALGGRAARQCEGREMWRQVSGGCSTLNALSALSARWVTRGMVRLPESINANAGAVRSKRKKCDDRE